MFTIIYEKESGNVVNISSESNAENLEQALPITQGFIFVEELPEKDFYRQKFVVEDGKLSVKNLVLNEEQERWIVSIETNNKIEAFKDKLASMDYKTSKYVDGEYTEEEWEAIVAERRSIREQIRELEKLKPEVDYFAYPLG